MVKPVKASHERTCFFLALMAFLTAGYTVYVTLTHGDGVAFAAFVGGVAAITGYFCGKKK